MVAGRWFQLFKDVHREPQLMVAGRWFQLFMIRCENDFALTNTTAGFFRTFLRCPRVVKILGGENSCI